MATKYEITIKNTETGEIFEQSEAENIIASFCSEGDDGRTVTVGNGKNILALYGSISESLLDFVPIAHLLGLLNIATKQAKIRKAEVAN